MRQIGSAACAALFMVALATAPARAAPQPTGWGAVGEIEGGWAVNAMSVQHASPLVNPAGCSVTNAGYATNPSDTGASLFHTLLLSALLNRVDVRLLIDGCAFNKPRIIAVTLR